MKNWIFLILALFSFTARAGYETGPANSVLVVPGSGGRPTYGPVNLSSPAAVASTLPTARGGLGVDSSAFNGPLVFASGVPSAPTAAAGFFIAGPTPTPSASPGIPTYRAATTYDLPVIPYANYMDTSGTTINNTVGTVYKYGTLIKDTTSSYNPSTGIYTAPIKGIYAFAANSYDSSNGIAASNAWHLSGYKNTTVLYKTDVIAGTGAGNTSATAKIFGTVDMLAGDTFSIQTFMDTSQTIGVSTVSGVNTFSIYWISN